MSRQTLHFTLGPVQAFVAQARRTRDLWAGSFLLSYLSGKAMAAVLEAKGSIIFPTVTKDDEISDPLLRAICNESVDQPPRIGTVPNRFKAELPAGVDPRIAELAVQEAWKEVAKAVWNEFVAHAEGLGNGTRAIWDRQVKGFWEIAWAVGEDNALLDRRKNWRTSVPDNECGEQCSIMSNLQELSGWLRVTSDSRKSQDKFWQKLRSGWRVGEFDLREGERLSAVALIKRLFPRISQETIGWKLDVSNWPSTVYMAAVPFLRTAFVSDLSAADCYADTVMRCCKEQNVLGEQKANLASLKRHTTRCKEIEGDFFFLDTLQGSPTRTPQLGDKDSPERKRVCDALREMNAAVGTTAKPFFAMLLMDGDRLGAMLQDNKGREGLISGALERFTARVEGVVHRHDGVTVYAGGDDVLALLPLDRALDASSELRLAYADEFKTTRDDTGPIAGSPTISAGVVFAHFSTPLTEVMAEAHRLLDEKAKEGMGRDAVAVSVHKSSGMTGEWTAKWDRLDDLRRLVAMLAQEGDGGFSTNFLYKFRETMHLLNPVPRSITGERICLPEGFPVTELLTANYLQAKGASGKEAKAAATEAVKCLLDACLLADGGPAELATDGVFIARFLAENTLEA